jgi:hypothetical protein
VREIFDQRAKDYACEGETADVFAVDFAEDAASRIRARGALAPATPDPLDDPALVGKLAN